jgi:1,4-alpha-glucan branching enzyme
MTRLSDADLYLFNEGTHHRLYDKLGVHLIEGGGAEFAVWAPNAAQVSVIGDWNGWQAGADPLAPTGSSGIWSGTVPRAHRGNRYKYRIESRHGGYVVDKADPVGCWHEEPPKTASVVWDTWYEWRDDDWMAERGRRAAHDQPVSIYELHLGSWRRHGDGRWMSYRELAEPLADYVSSTGFTHVELMPIMEHPFYGSWGYQVTGFFAPSARWGAPQDLMYLIDVLHQHGIGVIMDWVPAHFPNDEHGLAYFDGTHLYEHADPRKGFHPDWKSAIFNFGRHEVRSFLLSSAVFWLDRYHVDGLRVDAVASLLYLDYSREAGEWIPNEDGSNHNREAISFLRQMNEVVYAECPGVQTIAEESTAWPSVSRPTYVGGLGFGYKWDMGWMHDTLQYLGRDPIHRSHHHDEITFRGVYMFTENYVLPLSHDEVVHGKGSLLDRFPGDAWRKLAQLRLLLGYQWTQPGKKLLFMGCEVGDWHEWSHEGSVPWHLLNDPAHAGIRDWVTDLNALYRAEPALHQRDTDPAGFQWIDADDRGASTLSFLRLAADGARPVACAFNFTPIPLHEHRIALPHAGVWRELLNSDAPSYGGTGSGNLGQVEATDSPHHGRPASAVVALPPLGCVILGGGEP